MPKLKRLRMHYLKRKLMRDPARQVAWDGRLCYYVAFQYLRKLRPKHDQPLCPLAAELHFRAFIGSTGSYNPSEAVLNAAVSYVNREFCKDGLHVSAADVKQTIRYMTTWRGGDVGRSY